ncbi:MAG: hypothetical protein E4H09_00145 [Spirochaetales bacterium]|nr:MAG: hypothetical protein E4H09_00145 [Spirochaetales bacterium]
MIRAVSVAELLNRTHPAEQTGSASLSPEELTFLRKASSLGAETSFYYRPNQDAPPGQLVWTALANVLVAYQEDDICAVAIRSETDSTDMVQEAEEVPEPEELEMAPRVVQGFWEDDLMEELEELPGADE